MVSILWPESATREKLEAVGPRALTRGRLLLGPLTSAVQNPLDDPLAEADFTVRQLDVVQEALPREFHGAPSRIPEDRLDFDRGQQLGHNNRA